MKKIILIPTLLIATCTINSCGSGEGGKDDSTKKDTVPVEAPKATFADMCKDASSMAITIKGYKYDMSGDYAFEAANFEVKQSGIEWKTDSTATLTLKNYAPGDLVGDRKDDQVDIVVELYARHGKKIGPATYKHSAPELEYSSFTTMMTSKGKVYFNWVLGMNEQGSVTIDYIEGNKACGSFMLASEKPENEQIGTVRINGKFRTAD